MKRQCEFKGCKSEARWAAHKRFGDQATLHICDEHKPDPDKRPEALRSLPFYYRVERLEGSR